MTAPPQGRQHLIQPTWTTRNRVANFVTVQKAANSLHEALEYACTKHTEHQAQLSLQPKCSTNSQVSFTLAFTQMNTSQQLEGNTCVEPPMWLTVQSTVTGAIQQCAESDLRTGLQSSLKRLREATDSVETASKPDRKIKSVKFHTPLCEPLNMTPLQPLVSHLPQLMPNLCTHSNFCNQLQRFLGQHTQGSQTCVGYLEGPGNSKHLVYIDSRLQIVTSRMGRQSLRPLCDVYPALKQASSSAAYIPSHERIMLAKHLSIAVLQFHATPWLGNSICGKDVLLHEIGEPRTDSTATLREAFIRVPIKGPYGNVFKRDGFPNKTLIRNPLLFRLGVLLIELALQSSLRSLQMPIDIDANEGQNTDFHTALRACHQVEASLGPRYSKAVRRCLKCDFGHDEDLSEVKLQEAVYQGVVCELEELEQRFRAFGISI